MKRTRLKLLIAILFIMVTLTALSSCGGCEHEQTYSTVQSLPNCTEKGKTYVYCVECEELVRVEYAPALGHSYNSVLTKGATCESAGTRKHTCTKCNDTYEEVVPAMGHSYTSAITKQASCTEEGVISYKCKSCASAYTATISKNSHVYNSVITKQESCTEDGVKTYKCANCDDSYTEAIPKVKHIHNYSVTKPSTCTETGIGTYKCNTCTDSYTETISKLKHIYGSTVTKQTSCKEEGVKTYKCSTCTDSYTESIPKLNHTYNSTVTRQPSCAAVGIITYKCATCDDSYEEEIKALEHDVKSLEAILPTCQAEGITAGSVCLRCEKVLEAQVTLDKVAHSYASGICKWCSAREEYKITFKDGSTVVETVIYTVDTLQITPPEVPEHKGHTGEWESYTLNGTSFTVNAVYTPATYRIRLYPGLGQLLENQLTLAYGQEKITAIPSYVGHSFLGWFDSESAEANQIIDADGTLLVAAVDIAVNKLYAKYDIKKCTVTYDTGCDAVVEEQIYKYGESFVFPTEPTNEYNAFLGWYTADGAVFNGGIQITDDLKLYAKWDVCNVITNAQELLNIKNDPAGKYILANDINLDGEIWTPIDTFTGILNGNGFAIKNFVLNTTSTGVFGLFRVNSGTIKNVDLLDFTFTVSIAPSATSYYGVVAGNNQGIIEDVDLDRGTSSITSSSSSHGSPIYYGLIAGVNSTGKIIGCDVSVDFKAGMSCSNNTYNSMGWSHYIGGLVGCNNGTISESSRTGAINLSASTYVPRGYSTVNYIYFGGLIGINQGGVCEKSYSQATVTTTASANRSDAQNYINIGFVAGRNSDRGTISESYSKGTVKCDGSASSAIGGFVGLNDSNAYVMSCYSNVIIEESKTISNVGGFVGVNAGVVQNSYSAGDVASASNASVGGFVGTLTNSGSISKSYSTGDVVTASGSAGHFVGSASGTVLMCYFVHTSTIMINGQYVSTVTEYNTIEGKLYTELWNEAFLVDELYWEEEGWIVIVDDNPLLSWETETGHSFTTYVYEPTCVYGGFTVYSCGDCERLFIKDYVDPTGHDFEVKTSIPPSCFLEGYTLLKCKTCGHEEKSEIKAPTGHLPEDAELLSRKDATCTEDGEIKYHCAECNNNYTVTLDMLGHNGTLTSHTQLPTCTVKGIDTYHCDRCGEDYDIEVECIPHTPVSVDYLAPTCTKDNGFVETTDGHFPGERCEVCDTVLWGCELIEPHNYTMKSTVTAATCTAVGLGKFECSICSNTDELELPALGHKDANRDNICDTCSVYTFTSVPSNMFTEISTAQQLYDIRNRLGGYYILTADIDISGLDWTPIGTSLQPFKGVLYGNGHKITGLKIEANDAEGSLIGGIFGYNSGTIANLTVDSVTCVIKNVNANTSDGLNAVIGGIAAYNKGDIISCKITGNTEFVFEVILAVNDYARRKINASVVFGGICGENDITGRIVNCTASGHFNTAFVNKSQIISLSILHNIWALVNSTKAETVQSVVFGAICGRNNGEIDTCNVDASFTNATAFLVFSTYTKGKVEATSNFYTGSLVGMNSGSISSCTATMFNLSITEGVQYENKSTFIRAKLYEYGMYLHNFSKLEGGTSGVIGNSTGTVSGLVVK